MGVLLVLLSVPLVAGTSAPEVETSAGLVSGSALPANSGGVAVSQFLGIPYAYAGRFEPPVDFVGRYPTGAINATWWGSACMQVADVTSTTYGSEDCLKANVWKPAAVGPGSKLPVMVFVYGGSNQFGEAEPYNMSALAAFHNVVCVSFNYRTGPLGWMAFPEDVAARNSTGNWGILDIQSALRWVQREAHNFGGDKARVAIHGQSSGAGLVELQYVAPESSGLFRGAVSESGGLSAGDLQSALRTTATLAHSLGCLAGSALKACLAKLPAVRLTGATYSYSWGPVVDGVTFPQAPQQLLEDGLVNDATIVLGAQTNDSNLFLFRRFTRGGLDQPNDHPDGALTPMSVQAYKAALFVETGPRHIVEALSLYPPVHASSIENVHRLGNVQSDRMHCGARQRVKQFDRVHPGRAFQYKFDYWYTSNPRCTAVPNYHLPYLGAAHQDEVTFVLGQPNFMESGSCCGVWGLTTDDCPHLGNCEACYAPKRFGHSGYLGYFDSAEWEFTRLVGTLWTNVAASGNPNKRAAEAGSAAIDLQAWPEDVSHSIVLNASLAGGYRTELTPHGHPQLCDFWDKVRVDADNHSEKPPIVV